MGEPPGPKFPIRSIKSGNYITHTIDGKNIKLYIDDLNDEIIFTIYDPDDPINIAPLDVIPSADRSSIAGREIYWDNHYHFIKGKANHIDKKYKVPNNIAILFHKTIQKPGQKTHINCYFFKSQNINHIEDIDCLQSKNNKMKNKFPIGSMDLELIREIIQRPFRGSSSSHGGRSTRKRIQLRRRTKKQRKF